MKLSLILFYSALGLVACNDEQQAANVIDATIEISVKSKADGSDLLDPANSNALDESQIRIYHFIDGAFVEVNEPLLDLPKGYLIYKHERTHRITIGGEVFQESKMTSLIKWNSTDTDTLRYEIKRYAHGATVVITNVTFNDLEVWDESSDKERYFEITK